MDQEITQEPDDLKITNEETQLPSFDLELGLMNLEKGDKESIIKKLKEEECYVMQLQSLLLSKKLECKFVVKAVEIVAEITKNDAVRKMCTDAGFISYLLELLSSDDNALLLQAVRALGNICYINDEACEIVMNYQGVYKIIDLLNSLYRIESTETRYLVYVSIGCLMNLTDTIEKVQEQAIEAGAISLLLNYLEKYYEDEEIAANCLLVLNCLSVCENGKTQLMEKSSLKSLMNGLEKSLSSDLMDSLLDLLEYLAENDPAKINMAELGMGDIMLKVIEKCQQNNWENESQHILKLACDLIILILTGDTSMSILYDDGNGNVYQKTKYWLNSDDDVMQIAGALAAGNFARKDSYCIQMVEDHISESLLSLLVKHSTDSDIRLLHAVLSALRNLAIPAQNKVVLAQQGAIDKLLPLISVEAYPVIFKLLGILRMLIDKQEKAAVILGENNEFVKKVIEWCKSDDHPGVKGESTRTIAWLVKNSLNQHVMKNIVEAGGLLYLIEMISSKYPVMQNEAIVALTLIASTVLSSCKDAFDMEKISCALCQCLSGEVAPEVIQNILTFISILASSELKEELLKWTDIKTSIQNTSESSNEDISKQAKNILQILE